MEESWTNGGEGPGQQVPDWSTKLDNVAWSEANGKFAILNSYNTTEAGNTYGLASMLLVAGGWSSSTRQTQGIRPRPGIRSTTPPSSWASPSARSRCCRMVCIAATFRAVWYWSIRAESGGGRRPGRDVLRVGSDGRVSVCWVRPAASSYALRVWLHPDPAGTPRASTVPLGSCARRNRHAAIPARAQAARSDRRGAVGGPRPVHAAAGARRQHRAARLLVADGLGAVRHVQARIAGLLVFSAVGAWLGRLALGLTARIGPSIAAGIAAVSLVS